MYQIISLTNGQPMILYQENESVFLYSISNGRISGKGILFEDYKSDLCIYNQKFLAYKTLHDQYKFYKIIDERFIELFSLPDTTQICTLNDDIFIFYIEHESLYCIKCSSFNKSSLILKKIHDYYLSTQKDCILLSTIDKFYLLTSDLKLSPLQCHDPKLKQLEKELLEKNNEIQRLNKIQQSITEQYNELASYAGKLQDELRKYRYTK